MGKGLILNFKNLKLFIVFSFSFICLSLLFTNCGKPSSENSDSSSNVVTNDVGSSFSGKITSSIWSVSKQGEIFGYALDPDNPKSTIKVIFYIDGPAGTGQYAGETQANVQWVGANAGHYFSFRLPAQFMDGKTRVLYSYGFDTKPELTLNPYAMVFNSYTPKAESVFNEQLKPFIANNCARCHADSWTYTALYYGPLLNPTPAGGATATTNLLIKKMAGLTGHNGGQFCSGGVNSDICLEIQRWWNAEFK